MNYKNEFDEFMIQEFIRQQENVMQIINLTFQKTQFFLNLETFVIGAFVSFMTIGVSNLIDFMFIPAIFLSYLGHITFKTLVNSIIQELTLDFASNMVRLYFYNSNKDGGRYLYFGREFLKKIRDLENIKWKNNQDPSTFLAIFVGNINSFNISMSIIFTIWTIFRLIGVNITTLVFVLVIPILLIIQRLYMKKFYYDFIDYSQEKWNSNNREYLSEISG